MPEEIALVEDEQNIRDTVAYALRGEGYRVLAYADDYLCKPFSVRELCARVKVLLRRRARREPGEALRVGALELDSPRHTARWKGEPVRLTVTEFRMLRSLACQPGIVKTREQLLAESFPHDQYMSDRTVDTHIKRLRRKLAAADPAFAGIQTIYGLGYRYAAEG
jgi:two-component system response regulator ChvI